MARFLTQVVLGLGSGLVGALALTAAHEGLRRNTKPAPRMDVLGMRAFRDVARGLGFQPPRGKELRRDALVGDVVANAAYYALVARGRRPFMRGASLGLLAGIGAIVLPPMLGLGRSPRSTLVRGETVGLYVLGGLAAAATAFLVKSIEESRILSCARAAAAEVATGVNQRNSGMIH